MSSVVIPHEEHGWTANYRSVFPPAPTAKSPSSPFGSTLTGGVEDPVLGLSWCDVDWFAQASGGAGERQVLHSLSGDVPQGNLASIMGPSGSGKSTLLDILAMRKSTGRIAGFIGAGGRKRRPGAFQRACAYVPQEDALLPTLTVGETMWYYTQMLTPKDVGNTVRSERIHVMLKLVGLAQSATTLVGGPLPGGLSLPGLSGGERKRLSIAARMLTQPALVFADEPTSGLDAFAGLKVVEVLRQLASGGRIVIISIHQPRDAVWRLFDQVYLLSMGRLLYGGSTSGVEPWFRRLGYQLAPGAGLAEWLLDVVTVSFDKSSLGHTTFTNEDQVLEAAKDFTKSDCGANLRRNALAGSGFDCLAKDGAWPQKLIEGAPLSTHLRTLLWRHSLNYWRNFGNFVARLVLGVLSGLLIGTCYCGLASAESSDPRTVKSWLGALFFMCLNLVLSPFCSMSIFVGDRRFYAGEAAAKLYRPSSYYFPFVLCETVVNLLAASCVWTPTWLLLGLPRNAMCFLEGFLASGLVHLCGAQIAIFSALLLPSQELAFASAVAINIVSISTAGFLVKTSDFPMFLRWLRLGSPVKYAFQSLAVTLFASRKFNTSAQVAALDDAFLNLTQGIQHQHRQLPTYFSHAPVRWMFHRVATDVLDIADPCLLGTVQSGEKALECLELDEPSTTHIWPSIFYLLVQLLVFHVLSWLCLRHLHKEKR